MNRYLVILYVFITGAVLTYNFKVAYENRYQFGGDASDFIHLGLTLAKTGKYGHLDLSHKELVEGFSNSTHAENSYEFTGYTSFRPPVWPFIIAGGFIISGYSLTFIIVIKFLLFLAGGWFFYRILSYLGLSKFWIFTGCFLYLINPAWQLYSRVFLSEPLTLFFMTIYIWSLIRYLKTEKGFWMNGLLGGVLILSHPYYLFLPFSIWFFMFLNKKLHFRKFLLISILATAVVSVWMIRNKIVLNADKLLITTSSGAVMAKGWNSKVPELHTNTKGDLADETLVLRDYEYDKSDYSGEVGGMELYQDATINFIKSNPDMILPVIWEKLVSAFNPLPETPRPGVLETGRVIYQVMALFALIFIIIMGSREMRPLALGLLVSTILITIITYSGFRFRMPQSALEILFIIVAINSIIEIISKKRLTRVS